MSERFECLGWKGKAVQDRCGGGRFSQRFFWEFSHRFFGGEDDFPFLTFISCKGFGSKPPTRIVRPPMTDPGDSRKFYATNG